MLDFLLQSVFWLLALLGVYSYFLYPLILRLMPSRESPAVGELRESDRDWPSMSVIVTAHNEESKIREKLENLLALPAYQGELEILVASDASSDGTDDIVREYEHSGVALVRNPERGGKEAAQAMAIDCARGSIIVFSDVATSMQGRVLEDIARCFADPGVGALSSTDKFVTREGQPTGEGAYVKYEMLLRREETRVNSLVGLSGSFFAARADVCRSQWSSDIPSDFMTAVNCVRLGYVAVSSDEVIGYYSDLADSASEYRRKVRTVLRGMRAIAQTMAVLSPRRYGFFAIQIWSHKIMRWMAPWFWVMILPLNVILIDRHMIYTLSMITQVSFYTLVLVGAVFSSMRKFLIVRFPYYFAFANLAVMHAAIEFTRGTTIVTWTPSKR